MLVQFMLYHACVMPNPNFGRNIGRFGPVIPPYIGNGPIYPFNGIYAPELDVWVEYFQMAANAEGFGPLGIDGCVPSLTMAGAGRPPFRH